MEESGELACLTGLRAGRAQFFRAVTERAGATAPARRRERDGSLTRDYAGLLRSDGAGQIAEFFYLVEELGLKVGTRFRGFLDSHNAAMEAHLADPGRMRRTRSCNGCAAAVSSPERSGAPLARGYQSGAPRGPNAAAR